MRVWTECIRDRLGTSSGLVYGNEPPGSIRIGELVDQLKDCQLVKNSSAPWNKVVT
jgi:hypothetical protein